MLAVLAVALARPAHACSCLIPPLRRTLLIDDGAVVPPDAHIRVLLSGPWPTARRHRLTDELRIRGPDGEPVATSPRSSGRLVELVPDAPLDPGSSYVIEQSLVYGDGRRLSDDHRWDLTGTRLPAFREPRPAALTRHWAPVARFSVSTQPPPLPDPVAVLDSTWTITPSTSSCGPGETLRATLAGPLDLATGDVLSVELSGQGVVWHGGAGDEVVVTDTGRPA